VGSGCCRGVMSAHRDEGAAAHSAAPRSTEARGADRVRSARRRETPEGRGERCGSHRGPVCRSGQARLWTAGGALRTRGPPCDAPCRFFVTPAPAPAGTLPTDWSTFYADQGFIVESRKTDAQGSRVSFFGESSFHFAACQSPGLRALVRKRAPHTSPRKQLLCTSLVSLQGAEQCPEPARGQPDRRFARWRIGPPNSPPKRPTG